MSTTTEEHDLCIIGAGIVGLATARALLAARPGLALLVLEAEERVGAHQTGHNSGVIHSGLYYKPGSLKASLCAEGREALFRYCDERGLAHERCGKLVVATEADQLGQLDELERRGRANGLVDIERLDRAGLKVHEPHVEGVAGLRVGETGIVDYREVARAFAEDVRSAGGEVMLNRAARGIRREGQGFVIETTSGALRSRCLINCAGAQADRVARRSGLDPGLRIVPFRGEYKVLRPERADLVRNLIYPVPDPRFPFLGVHFTRMIGGGVEAGPNAVLALHRHGYSRWQISARDLADMATYPGFWRMLRSQWRSGAGELWRSLSHTAFTRALQTLLPSIRPGDLQPGGSGVRAQALDPDGTLADDFRISAVPGAYHVLCAPSPAATASLAIGRHLADGAARHLGL